MIVGNERSTMLYGNFQPGGPRDDGTWDGLIDDLNRTVIDVAVAIIAVTKVRFNLAT